MLTNYCVLGLAKYPLGTYLHSWGVGDVPNNRALLVHSSYNSAVCVSLVQYGKNGTLYGDTLDTCMVYLAAILHKTLITMGQKISCTKYDVRTFSSVMHSSHDPMIDLSWTHISCL